MPELQSKQKILKIVAARLKRYSWDRIKRKILPNIFFYRYFLSFPKHVKCPYCGWDGRYFVSYRGRKNEMCPRCGSMQRHRFLYLLLGRIFKKKIFSRNPRILHVAPEVKSIGKYLKDKSLNKYLSIDIVPNAAMKTMDVTDLADIKNDSFDLIVACAVLEHIKEEGKALREIMRVLKGKTGIAVLYVPINRVLKNTYEFTASQTEKDISHHVREYGLDFFKRVRTYGFTVNKISALAFPIKDRRFFGFRAGQCAAICSK